MHVFEEDETDNESEDDYDISIVATTTNKKKNKFTLVVPEFYHSYTYGRENFDVLSTHIMVKDRIKLLPNCSIIQFLKNMEEYRKIYQKQVKIINNTIYRKMSESKFTKIITPIRNYIAISENENKYMQLEIAETIHLPGTGETICILKTIWLKIIQRKWKNVYAKKKKYLRDIYHRQMYGKTLPLPRLKGMLFNLNKNKIKDK